jgi:hypothetical protein
MDDLLTVASSLNGAADQLADHAPRLDQVAGYAAAFGGDSVGRPGALGRRLFAQWAEALHARRREIAEALDEVTDLTTAVRQAAGSYAEAEHVTARLMPRQT